jgi:hypothetical protein
MSSAKPLARIEAFRQGRFVVIVDDEDRENEGDLAIAAEKVTPASSRRAASRPSIVGRRAADRDPDPRRRIRSSVSPQRARLSSSPLPAVSPPRPTLTGL